MGSSFPQYQFPILSKTIALVSTLQDTQSKLRYGEGANVYRGRAELFYKAWNSIGVPSNPQPNGGRAVDAFYSTSSLTAWNQSRCSAATAYYRPIADKRPNFHLLTLHSVTKVMIDKRKKRATGVQVC